MSSKKILNMKYQSQSPYLGQHSIFPNRCNYSDQILTLNHKLPVIHHVVHDKHFQYHIMKTAKDYTNYLNPGQTAVGSSDFPLYYL